VIPEFMKSRELAYDEADELVTVVTMRRAQAPDGDAGRCVRWRCRAAFGTLEEIMRSSPSASSTS